MDKARLFLILLTVGIILGPLAGVIFVYRDNLAGLILPPQIENLAIGNYTQVTFQPPTVIGSPQYDLATQTITLTFNFTNPLPIPIAVENFTGEVACREHNYLLGSVSFPGPLRVGASQTTTFQLQAHLTLDGIIHIITFHSQESSVAIVFRDLNIQLAGAKIHIDTVDAGSIPLPQR